MNKDEIKQEIAVEEYKSCRDLIKINIEIIEKSEVYGVGACAAIATFCLSATDEAVQRASCWIPLIISLLGLLRYIGLDVTIKKVNNYLAHLEKEYELIGWTTYYRSKNKWKILKRSRYAIWIVLAVGSVVLEAKIYRIWPFLPPAAVTAQRADTAEPTAPVASLGKVR